MPLIFSSPMVTRRAIMFRRARMEIRISASMINNKSNVLVLPVLLSGFSKEHQDMKSGLAELQRPRSLPRQLSNADENGHLGCYWLTSVSSIRIELERIGRSIGKDGEQGQMLMSDSFASHGRQQLHHQLPTSANICQPPSSRVSHRLSQARV